MKLFNIHKIIATLAAALLLTTGVPAIAQQQSLSLSSDVMLKRQVVTDGQTSVELVEPNVVVPGDHLIFTTKYENVSSEPVEDFVVTNPLPKPVMLAPGNTEALKVSIDGGANFALLSELTVTEEDGSVRAATASDVTHLRWTLSSIEPGQSGELTYEGIVR